MRLLRDRRRREGAEADAPLLDEREAEVAAPEDVEDDVVRRASVPASPERNFLNPKSVAGAPKKGRPRRPSSGE